jgi:hypothetical protein
MKKLNLQELGKFLLEETEKALFEFDGHTSKDVLERMTKIIKH